MGDTIEAETAKAPGRTFIKGNNPEINPVGLPGLQVLRQSRLVTQRKRPGRRRQKSEGGALP